MEGLWKEDYISKNNILSVRQQYRARFGLEKFAAIIQMTGGLPVLSGSVDVKRQGRRSPTSHQEGVHFLGTRERGLVIFMMMKTLYISSKRFWQGGTNGQGERDL